METARSIETDDSYRERFPGSERERLATLRRYEVLDTPPEERFDRITRLAAHLFEAPVAQITLVDTDRQWAKSTVGVDRAAAECARENSWCARVIETPGVEVVEDVAQDARFAGSRFATESHRARFYAAAPLTTAGGMRLGTLCVFDTQPRPAVSNEKKVLLRDLAATVVDELELRRSLEDTRAAEQALHASEQKYARLFESANDAILIFEPKE
jgi:GAF domain-containing protein